MCSLPFTDERETVCFCMGVTAFDIKKAVYEKGLTTVEEVTAATRAGGGCRSCHYRIQELIDDVLALKAEQK